MLMKKRISKELKLVGIEVFWILPGVLSAAFGLQSFLLPNNFIDGGATGIALLISETTFYDIAIVILLVNVPFIFIGYLQMRPRFVVKTIIAVVLQSVVLAFVTFPIITEDLLLASVFGGFFLGAGLGLTIRGGCAIDGTEILALYFSRKIGISLGDIIIIFNIFIFAMGAWLIGIEEALYSMLAYFIASKTMDFVIQGIEEYLGVTIISNNSEKIKEAIISEMNTGVTVLRGLGGYGKKGRLPQEVEVLYTVVTRLEMLRINRIVKQADDEAFMVIQGVRDVKGGMLKKRPIPE